MEKILADHPDLKKAVEFHGHLCPGLTIGYRASQAALKRLGAERAQDEEVIAIVHTDACGVDALQVMLGCTLGKGNLIFKDYGKQVYIIGNRETGKAVRVALRPDPAAANPEQTRLRNLVFGGEATPEQEKEFGKLQQERTQQLLQGADEELFMIKEINLELPGEAKIFASVVCHDCGEAVMEARAHLREGQPVCPECYQEYTRGW
ncbi:MAG TPA: FmdE family protein [Patescibacteria group bacterium]|nr:FmdE family protein [Patescibacteria group bacterium]